jgi:hypothetical protein
VHLRTLEFPAVLASVIGRRPSVQGHQRPGVAPSYSGRIGNRADPPGGLSLEISGSLGRPTLKSRRPAAVDRQVRERPVDRLHRSDRPLRQMGDDNPGELVDLAVKGQLAPA